MPSCPPAAGGHEVLTLHSKLREAVRQAGVRGAEASHPCVTGVPARGRVPGGSPARRCTGGDSRRAAAWRCRRAPDQGSARGPPRRKPGLPRASPALLTNLLEHAS